MENRKYIRTPEKIEFYYKSNVAQKNDWIHGYTQDLSLGGALAWIKGKLPLGARVALRLTLNFLSRGTTVCNLPAMVIRHADVSLSGEEGVGVIFLHERMGDDKALLATYLNEKDEIRKRGSRRILAQRGTARRDTAGMNHSPGPVKDMDGRPKKKSFLSRIFGKS